MLRPSWVSSAVRFHFYLLCEYGAGVGCIVVGPVVCWRIIVQTCAKRFDATSTTCWKNIPGVRNVGCLGYINVVARVFLILRCAGMLVSFAQNALTFGGGTSQVVEFSAVRCITGVTRLSLVLRVRDALRWCIGRSGCDVGHMSGDNGGINAGRSSGVQKRVYVCIFRINVWNE